MTVRVNVDLDLCQSHGECCLVAPDLFELDDDDLLHWKAEVDDSRREDVEHAEQMCPVQAITVE